MARVPGLVPVEDGPDLSRRRVKERVEVDPRGGVEIPALRPVAAPINTYARPPQPVRDDRLARLADALGALNSGLQSFGSAYMAKQNTQQTEAATKKAIVDANSGVQPTREQLLAMPEVARKAYELQQGRLTGGPDATKFMTGVIEEYQKLTPEEREKLDIDGFMASRLKAWQEQNTDKAAPYLETFSRNVYKDWETFKTGHIAAVEKIRADRADIGMQQFAFDKIIRGFQEGRPAEEVLAEIRQMYKDNKDFAKLDYARQDKALVAALTQFAGDPRIRNKEAFVETFLRTERIGEDGTKLGTLQSRLEGANYNTLLSTARRSDIEADSPATLDLFERTRKASDEGTYHTDPRLKAEVEEAVKNNRVQPGFAAALDDASRTTLARRQQEAAVALEKARANSEAVKNNTLMFNEVDTKIKDGKAFELPPKIRVWKDDNGKATDSEVDAKTYIEKYYVPAFKEKLASDPKISPEEKAKRLIDFYASVPYDVKNPEWENTLRGGFMTSNLPNLTADKVPEVVDRGYEVYRQLNQKNRPLLEQHASKEALDWYDTVDTLMQAELASSPRDAMTRAHAIREIYNKDSTLRERRVQEVEKAAKTVGNLSWGWDTTPKNLGYVQNQIRETAQMLAPYLDGPSAVKKAKEIFDKTHITVNGMSVKVNDKNLPEWYGSEVEKYIEDYVTRYKNDSIESKADVGFFSHKGQLFLVGPDGDFLYNDKAPPDSAIINLRKVTEFREKRLAAERAEAEKKVAEEAKKTMRVAPGGNSEPAFGTPEWEMKRREVTGENEVKRGPRGNVVSTPKPAPAPTPADAPPKVGSPEWEAERQRRMKEATDYLIPLRNRAPTK